MVITVTKLARTDLYTTAIPCSCCTGFNLREHSGENAKNTDIGYLQKKLDRQLFVSRSVFVYVYLPVISTAHDVAEVKHQWDWLVFGRETLILIKIVHAPF